MYHIVGVSGNSEDSVVINPSRAVQVLSPLFLIVFGPRLSKRIAVKVLHGP